jgi:hypothetical protein
MGRYFILDVETRSLAKIRQWLKKKKSVLRFDHGSPYHVDPNYAQVRVEADMTEDEFDDWLYRSCPGDYVGVLERAELEMTPYFERSEHEIHRQQT